jgi:hypothetical protein
LTVEKWKAPSTASGISAANLHAVAAIMSYGTKFGQYPKPEQVDYLCNADAGPHDLKTMVDYVAPDSQFDRSLANSLASDEDAKPETPDALRTNLDALNLANAFYNQMLNRTSGVPHLIGEYRMTKTSIDLVDDLQVKEFRFVITVAGMWLSTVFPDDTFAPAWWGPGGDTFQINYGLRYAWIFRTFCACLWHDLHAEAEYNFRVKKDREQRSAGKSRPGEKVIRLPKSVRKLDWEEGLTRSWNAGNRRDYSVRAHYRHLHEGWQPSQEAVDRALTYGFPEPPDGYTFVSPYDVGEESFVRPPRIVAKGLRAAQVALARL